MISQTVFFIAITVCAVCSFVWGKVDGMSKGIVIGVTTTLALIRIKSKTKDHDPTTFVFEYKNADFSDLLDDLEKYDNI